MKRIVLTFGCLSGAVSAAMMWATVPFLERIGFDNAAFVGYTAIVLSFLFVFFGVRAYREHLGDRPLTFASAFTAGLLITYPQATRALGTHMHDETVRPAPLFAALA